jgi:hypothetical protein
VGWFPLAFEHSKVCTLCNFGHLQLFIVVYYYSVEGSARSFRSNHVPHLDGDDFSSM